MPSVKTLARALVTRQYRYASKLGRRPVSKVHPEPGDTLDVLVIGVGLTHKKSYWQQLVADYAESAHRVTQRWALVPSSDPPSQKGRLSILPSPITPRAELLNRLLHGVALHEYDYVLISDDDARVPASFMDKFLYEVTELGFELAQPARSQYGYNSHNFVVQKPGRARETRFVEIGPVVAIQGTLAQELLPFDESNPMTWGQELVWSKYCYDQGHKMGIIDSVPIDHCLRPVAASYDFDKATIEMLDFFARTPHLTFDEAKIVVQQHT